MVKLLFFCLGNVAEYTLITFFTVSGISVINDVRVFLGVFIIYGRVKRSIYDNLFIKMRNNFFRWKEKFLFLAGRITLVKSVFTVMLRYII